MLLRFGKSREFYLPVADRLSLNKSREVQILSRYLDLKPGEGVLDVACGSGYWTTRLASKYDCHAVGIDFSEHAISMARRHHNGSRCRYFVCQAESLPFPTGSFDKILSICALEHFTSDGLALSEMSRVLRDEGVLAISVDSFSPPFVSEEYRQWHRQKFFVNNFYKLDEIREKLEVAGFEVMQYQYLLTSRLSFWLFRLLYRFRNPLALFVPILYPLSLLSDKLTGNDRPGLMLALKAKKKSAPPRH